MSDNAINPFARLQDYERRSLLHAVGLPEQESAPGAWSGIWFRLLDADLISGIDQIEEILIMPDVTRVPGSKSWLLGIANVRGNLVPIIDMCGFLVGKRATVTDRNRVLVVGQEGGTVGLLVDEVHGQRHLVDEDLAPDAAGDDHPTHPYVDRCYQRDGRQWNVFDMQRLVADPEFLQAAV